MRFFARRRRILPRRSSTAGSGVEPICKALPIAPSTYHEHVARRRNPDAAPARVRRDAVLSDRIQRAFNENFQVYGVRKVWRQLQRQGEDVARCTVARLMRDMGLQGAVRGKRVKTTIGDRTVPSPLDQVKRQFQPPRPNALWVSDFTYVATWAGFVYVAFVIDAFAPRIVGWRVSRTAHASFVVDALEQALLRSTASSRRRPRPPQRQSEDKRQFPGGLTLTAMDPPARLAPRGARCGLTRTPIDRPCLSPDLSAAPERLAVRLCLARCL